MIRFPPRRILVPADLSEPSLAAVRAGAQLARRFRAALSLVYAESLPPSLLGFDADEAGEYARQAAEFRAWRLERLRREAAGVPAKRVHARVLRGRPEALAAELGAGRVADLIVMGTHGRKGLARLAGGSVAEDVVARARVPVLVVRPVRGPLLVRRVLCPVNLTPHADEALRAARAAARAFGARLTALHVRGAGDDA
ncbi:MAG: universal stress protein, partial [Elusimicrobia bacterium]|nr:universal stress protein [Elusimicrobiota bacterium]